MICFILFFQKLARFDTTKKLFIFIQIFIRFAGKSNGIHIT
jgi:hypothetical protein